MVTVSIIIPTYNRLPRLKQVIAAVEQQTYPLDEVEVIVVSDGSTDGTHEYLSTLRTPLKLRFVAQANAGPAAARNNGIRNASGDYVLFIDDDVVPSPQLLAEHMRCHAGQTNLVVLGPMLNPPDFNFSAWVAWEQAMLIKQYEALQSGDWEPTPRQFYTGNTSLSRQILIDSGGFDERFRRAEDIELAYRLEKLHVQFTFSINAVGYHYADRSFTSWLQIPYSYGRYDVVFSNEQDAYIMDFINEEFGHRNLLTRLTVRLCLDRPQTSNRVQEVARWTAEKSYPLGALGKLLSRVAYSVIFNLRYYQGIADELGGRGILFDGIKAYAASHKSD